MYFSLTCNCTWLCDENNSDFLIIEANGVDASHDLEENFKFAFQEFIFLNFNLLPISLSFLPPNSLALCDPLILSSTISFLHAAQISLVLEKRAEALPQKSTHPLG